MDRRTACYEKGTTESWQNRLVKASGSYERLARYAGKLIWRCIDMIMGMIFFIVIGMERLRRTFGPAPVG